MAIGLEAVTTGEDAAVTSILAGEDGDSEVDQTLTFALAVEPEHGDVVIDVETGEFTYTPDPDYNGPDRFSFIVRDDDLAGEIAGLLSEPAWVTIAITPVADPVTANSDAYITEQDTALIVLVPDGLLANDSDVDGDAVTGVFVLPEHGDLILRRDGSFGYMPDEGYYGQDSFTYMMGNSGYVSQATVEITVNAIPVAEDDTAITEQDTPLTVSAMGVLDNDFDDYWGELTAELVSDPENGSLVLGADGSFTYTPDEGFYGEDWFSYRAFDGRAYSEEATVTITVSNSVSPIAYDDEYFVDAGQFLVIRKPGPLGNDVNPSGEPLRMAVIQQPSNFAFFGWTELGQFSYQPRPGFEGIDTFTYQASGDGFISQIATVRITVTAAGPTLRFSGCNHAAIRDASAALCGKLDFRDGCAKTALADLTMFSNCKRGSPGKGTGTEREAFSREFPPKSCSEPVPFSATFTV